jgi:S-adenosylmethionine synthetase
MPAPIHFAHLLTKRLADVRKKKVLPWLRPDGKSQVAVEYVDGRPTRIDSIVVSTQHADDVSNKQIHEAIVETVIKKSIGKKWIDKRTRFLINPTGRFVIGGPMGDAGVTGRRVHRRHRARDRRRAESCGCVQRPGG